ncbi:UNVERIFIED_CONTAM: hypothetical protein GTU68_001681 [Idotea baltica]|nr:hypothetical protein [Idotea baltica]
MANLFDKPNADIKPIIEESWAEVLHTEFQQPYFRKIKQFLTEEIQNKKVIYPKGSEIFAAFNAIPIKQVKVVILGQDPYHGTGQANGLCFSVNNGVKHPKSLINIFKEIESQTGTPYPTSGNLMPWAKQGVFLLNAILTVEAQHAASHQHIGWQQFTNAVISTISKELEGVIFLLWGRYAQNKAQLINAPKHHILQSAHPSPLAAYRGFFGNGHFNKVNEILVQQGKQPINWAVE